ncbi:MAG: OmpA family protein [Rhodospirillales bacterium]
MTPLAAPPPPAFRTLLALVVAAVPLLSSGSAARAQGVDLNTEHVTVDLSVIGDMGRPMFSGAVSPSPMVAQPRGAGGLLVPGPTNPMSRLHVAVPAGPGGERITLKPPSAAPKKTVAAPAAKKSAPAKPADKTVASAPPAPLTVPPPAPAMPAEPTVKGGTPAAPPAPAQPEKKPEPAAKTAAAPPAAKPRPVKTEQASSPPAAVMKEGRALQVAFAVDVSKLPDAAKDGLTTLAKQLKENENLRLQLMAYAGGKDLSPSKARRLSLSRALSVRSFLIESGVRSTRIDVRALGDKTAEEPLNRVDVNIVER